ncbi:shikimate dehydrogenase, partial [Odoribacter sp. OttesenSCG-928-A06]|nr:shikimate dehydrogenase [Odoribacter sp. OttesenSCG-928-A06]
MKKFGLIGFPLGHSFSKKYFMEKFQREKIDAEYLNFEIEDIALFRDVIRDTDGLCGLNVTIPYKQAIIPYLDILSKEAQEVGAVNCVKIERTDGKLILIGHNTDIYGFECALRGFIPSRVKRALILGSGGAACAVKYALTKSGAEVLTVSRTPKKEGDISYREISDHLPDCELIVNATPIGMFPNVEDAPDIPYEYLGEEHYL